MNKLKLLASMGVMICALTAANPRAGAAPAAPSDPFLWLEDVTGARATTWVKNENVKTLGVLENDRRYAGLYADAVRISTAKDRIPTPMLLAGGVYNFWQDNEHVRGIWRRTTVGNYGASAPAWDTVLDLDALSKAESSNWVWQSADCREPAEDRCLISLSDGGEDASTVREFDLQRRAFIDDGFRLPRGKQESAWEDGDTLLVSRE